MATAPATCPTVTEVAIFEPGYTVVLTHHATGRPGDVRHHPDGCTGDAGHSDRREAFYSEMHRLPPCQRCLAQV